MLDEPTPYGEQTSEGRLIHYYRDTLENVYYDVPTLWELSKGLPTFPLTPEQFNSFLMRECAWGMHPPVEVADEPEHWERIMEADTSHPVMIRFTFGEIMMVDGFHRIARAFLDGHHTHEAVDVSDLLEQAEIRDDYPWWEHEE